MRERENSIYYPQLEEIEKGNKERKLDTPESIREKLALAREGKEKVKIVREIPLGIVEETVYAVDYNKTTKVFVTESLIIKTKEGKEVNLAKFLNKDTILTRVAYNKEFYQNEEKRIDPYGLYPVRDENDRIILRIISYGSLQEDGSRLSLLHEIGHSHEPKELTNNVFRAQSRIEDDIEEAKLEERIFPTDKEILVKLPKSRPWPVSLRHFLKFHQLRAREERNAWAYALKVFKNLKNKGINLEPNLPTTKDLEKYIHGEIALGSYEIDLLREQQGEKTKAKVYGLYTKKFYRFFLEQKRKEKDKFVKR